MAEIERCSFLSCANPRMRSMDICASHRKQQLRGVELTPLKLKAGKPVNGKKICAWCREWLPLENFYLYPNRSKNRYYPACNECRTEWHRYTAIKGKYKLSPEEYDALIERGCGICGDENGLVIDHDHNCCPGDYTCGQCVREALCSACNLALGKMGDSIDRLRAAVRYLERHK